MSLFRSEGRCPPTIIQAFENGVYTDLTITCGNFTAQVHRLVVCTACDFFEKSIKFAVGREAEEMIIDMPEDDPDMIRRLITFLYLHDYDPSEEPQMTPFTAANQQEWATTSPNATHHSRYHKPSFLLGVPIDDICSCLVPTIDNTAQPMSVVDQDAKPTDYRVVDKPENAVEVANPLTIHANMYALADKYQVIGLRQVAKHKFESCLFHHINSGDFISAVQVVYTSTSESDRGLRDVVIKAFLEHFHVDVLKIPGFEAKIDCIDELSLELIKSWPVKTEPVRLAIDGVLIDRMAQDFPPRHLLPHNSSYAYNS